MVKPETWSSIVARLPQLTDVNKDALRRASAPTRHVARVKYCQEMALSISGGREPLARLILAAGASPSAGGPGGISGDRSERATWLAGIPRQNQVGGDVWTDALLQASVNTGPPYIINVVDGVVSLYGTGGNTIEVTVAEIEVLLGDEEWKALLLRLIGYLCQVPGVERPKTFWEPSIGESVTAEMLAKLL